MDKEDFQSQLNREERKNRMLERKLGYLTNNASIRYKLGDALIQSMKSGKAALKLPSTLYKLYKEGKSGMIQTDGERTPLPALSKSHESILFLPINGVGLGHLTRLLAIARRVKKLSPEKEIIFFSTSAAMHLIRQEGFLGYHLPSITLFPKKTSVPQWNLMFKEQLAMVLEMHQPSMLVFDGTYPYNGLLSNFSNNDDLRKVWIRRGRHKQGTKSVYGKEKKFDQIIEPGEAGDSNKSNSSNVYSTEPVIYLDPNELLNKDQVKRQWKAPRGHKLVYLQLGSGNNNDVDSILSVVIRELLSREDIFIVIGESVIGKRLDYEDDRVMVLRDYPNSRFFASFDFAISATGYNTYHELMFFGVPTIFIPNQEHITDNQTERAMTAQRAGAAVVLTEFNKVELSKAVDHVLAHKKELSFNAKNIFSVNGADQIAKMLME